MKKLFSVNFLSIVFMLVLVKSCGAQSTHGLNTAQWGASSTPGVTYAIRRGTVSGGTKTVVVSGITGLTGADTTGAANTFYCYDVIAQKSGLNDSGPSNEICGMTDKDGAMPPATFTGTIK